MMRHTPRRIVQGGAGFLIVMGLGCIAEAPEPGSDLAVPLPSLKECDQSEVAATRLLCSPDQECGEVRVVAVHPFDPDRTFGAEVIVRVDGVEVGTTDEGGLLELLLPEGQYDLEVVVPSTAVGWGKVSAISGEAVEVEIRLDADRTVTEHADLVLEESIHGALPLEAETLTFSFVRSGCRIPVSVAYHGDILTGPRHQTGYVTFGHMLAVSPAGEVEVTEVDEFRSIASGLPRHEMGVRIMAGDERGFTYWEDLWFILGVHELELRLEAPPSMPKLPVAGVPVRLELSGGTILDLTTDAHGRAQISTVPSGATQIHSAIEHEDHTYSGGAMLSIDGDVLVKVRMLGFQDVIDQVTPWELVRHR